MLSSSGCCVKGTIHNETPNGQEDVIHSLRTYIASGDSMKGVIVIIPDIFGWDLLNTRLLADGYARKTGLTVYVPDFMFGDSFPTAHIQVLAPDPDMPALPYITKAKTYGKFAGWMFKHREAVSWRIISTFFEELHKENTTRKVFVSGFCWGGRYACLLAQKERWILSSGAYIEGGLVDAIYTAHPSMLALPKEIELIAKPVSFAVGGLDERLPLKDVEKIKQILDRKIGIIESEVVIYEGAKHGFALRGNKDIPPEKEDLEDAEDQAVNWFRKFID